MRLLLQILLLSALILAFGCESARDTLRWVGRAPKVVDPEIDYKEMPGSDREKRLALLFAPVDERIELLARRVAARETPPDAEWHKSMAMAFPWLSGVAVLDAKGRLVEQIPDAPLKPFPEAELLALEKDWRQKGLRALAKADDLGPEVYLVNPLTERGQWLGLLVVHFDPRQLMRFSPAADQLVVFAPGAAAGKPSVALWPTVGENNAQGLLGMDWPRTLESDVHGDVRSGPERFVWLGRALGGTHIVYAMRDKR